MTGLQGRVDKAVVRGHFGKKIRKQEVQHERTQPTGLRALLLLKNAEQGISWLRTRLIIQ
jgi:hypothetical protein